MAKLLDRRELPESCLRYVLEGLIPYTDANLQLTFKPSLFFKELEQISKNRRHSLRNAYYKSIQQGLVKLDQYGLPNLTAKGLSAVQPYAPKQLKNAKLLVMFDIPEVDRWKRQHLRLLLKELSFVQVQKSVWESQLDHRQYLLSEIRRLKLEQCVNIYEALKL